MKVTLKSVCENCGKNIATDVDENDLKDKSILHVYCKYCGKETLEYDK